MKIEQLTKLQDNTHFSLSQNTKLLSEIEEIIKYIQTLDNIDTSNTPFFEHPLKKSVFLHEDLVKTPLPQEELLKNVPLKKDNQIIVPKVL